MNLLILKNISEQSSGASHHFFITDSGKINKKIGWNFLHWQYKCICPIQNLWKPNMSKWNGAHSEKLGFPQKSTAAQACLRLKSHKNIISCGLIGFVIVEGQTRDSI